MPTLEEVCKVTRRGKGKKRRSNLLTKRLAELVAKKDIENERKSESKKR
jgi:hypothetical protein